MNLGAIRTIRNSKMYEGKSLTELAKTLNIETTPSESLITKSIYNKVKHLHPAATPRTIRIKYTGKPIEALPLSNLNFTTLLEKGWVASDIYKELRNKEFLFFVYKTQEDSILEYCIHWKISKKMLDTEVKDFWLKLINIVKKGVILTEVEQMNKMVVTNNLPKMSNSPVIHIRPRAKDGSDRVKLPDGRTITKQAYWLSPSIIESVIQTYEPKVVNTEHISLSHRKKIERKREKTIVTLAQSSINKKALLSNFLEKVHKSLPYDYVSKSDVLKILEVTEKYEFDREWIYKVDQARLRKLNITKKTILDYLLEARSDIFSLREIREKFIVDKNSLSGILENTDYKINGNYILKRKHKSYSAYLRELVNKSDYIISENIVGNGTQIFNKKIDEFQVEYLILPTGKNEYITSRNLERSGITKSILLNFVERLKQFVFLKEAENFTLKSIRKMGFYSELFNLGFDDIFYETLIKLSLSFGSCIFDGSTIFSQDKEVTSMSSFLVNVVEYFRRIEEYDLLDYLNNSLSIKSDTYFLRRVLNGTSLYYSSKMECYYIDINEYYKEVYNDDKN